LGCKESKLKEESDQVRMSSEENVFDLIVVGGGAAGFYGAVQAAARRKGLKIAILEKSNKILAKVKVSGGGRCNVTHSCFDPIKLSHHYPRGEKFLQRIFKQHDATKTIEWFKAKGVELKTEEDGRIFPVTDNSQTIIDCLVREAERSKVKMFLGEGVISAAKTEFGFQLHTVTGKRFTSQNVLITTGGNPNLESYNWIASLGHTIVPPIPSLFTFNDSEKKFADLMGVSVTNAEVKIAGTKLSQTGPLLITHWGLSGPAVIKLSAWAAEALFQKKYSFTALVSWIGAVKENEVVSYLADQKMERKKQKVMTNPLYDMPQRLWTRLCELAEINPDRIWSELAQKNMNRLMELLIRCPFKIEGKTTFKEEFVTCGGVDLREIDADTMESKICPGLYFAGEVLNIDGETGGFNFQNAWSTSYIAARAIAKPVTRQG
jgi:predicted Rossmann fold flavoprotein